MKTKFYYEGHEIVFHRKVTYAALLIDGKECDVQAGFVESQMSSFTLRGELSSGESIRLEIKAGFFPDTAELYINDQLVQTKKAP